MDLSFYKDKTVLVTGHTGFKGTWLCHLLVMCGAKVIGYSLKPPIEPSLYSLTGIEKKITSVEGDIRNLAHLLEVFETYQPEIVIHMAAQPIVRESYQDPVYTYETNVLGTVHVLEAVRKNTCVKSVINVTTDKVYQNKEWEWGYRENDILDGYDPYSNSKSCSELVTNSYRRSFFEDRDTAISTCRAGNVIGGGDFAKDRIIPDCVRAMQKKEKIIIRNPYSIRPYQHVLEPVCAYLKLAELQYKDKEKYEGSYNIGPNERDCITTGVLAELFCQFWGDDAKWIDKSEENAPHESGFLKLDCSRAEKILAWKPKWDIKNAVKKTVDWSSIYLAGGDVTKELERQIKEYVFGEHFE